MHTKSSGHLVCLAADKQVEPVVLVAELVVQGIFESAKGGILVAGDGKGCGLVAGCVDLDLVLEGVVVDVVYDCQLEIV